MHDKVFCAVLNKQQLDMVCSNHKKSLCLGIAEGKRKAGGKKAVLTKPASSFLGTILPSTLSSHHYQPGSMKPVECLALEGPILMNKVKCLHSEADYCPWSVQMSHSRSAGNETLTTQNMSFSKQHHQNDEGSYCPGHDEFALGVFYYWTLGY